MSLKGEHMVVQHNKLIEHRGSMTIMEQKLLRAIVSEIRMDDIDLNHYSINVSEFKELTKTTHKDIYNQLDEATTRLMRRVIEIKDADKKGKRSFKKLTIMTKAEYIEGEGQIHIRLNDEIKPYLLELKDHFTQYQLKYVMQMKSVYTLRIYELLKQYESTRTLRRKFELEELKANLGIISEYPVFKDFEKRVLEVAKKEINALTDIQIDYKKLYRGDKQGKGVPVVGVEFSIDTKLTDEKKYVNWLNETYDVADIKSKSGLGGERFNSKQVMELYEVACNKTTDTKNDISPFEYIRLNYLYMIEKGTHRSKFKYLLSALQEDYANAGVQISLNYILEKQV